MIVIGCDDFSKNLANFLGVKFTKFERRIFADKEVCPRLPLFDDSEAMIVNRPSGDPNSCIIETYLMMKTLMDHEKTVYIFLPYLPYARQETAYREGEPFSVKYIMEMFRGCECMFTLTSHYERDKEIIEGPVRIFNINGFVPLARHIGKMGLENPLVVAPDAEIAPLSCLVAAELGAGHETIKKERDLSTGKIKTKGDIDAKDKDVVIVDDMVTTGSTMINAALIARSSGAAKIICACVHPVLSGDAEKRIKEAADFFIATNTIDSPVSTVKVEEYAAEHIRRLSASRSGAQR